MTNTPKSIDSTSTTLTNLSLQRWMCHTHLRALPSCLLPACPCLHNLPPGLPQQNHLLQDIAEKTSLSQKVAVVCFPAIH